MKKHLLVLFSILFFSLLFNKAHAQDTVSNGSTTTPINFPAGSCTYSWTNNNTNIGLDNNMILTPQASPAATTSYTITVQTAEGCMASDSVTVTVLDGITIPNTFTPNGDGVNDTWEVKNLKDYQNCTVLIFDRYGGQVYSSKGYPTAWDGTIGGRRLPTGTYYYIINLNNGTAPLAGWVALIR